MPIDPEAVHRHLTHRCLLRIETVAAHPKTPAGHLDHVLENLSDRHRAYAKTARDPVGRRHSSNGSPQSGVESRMSTLMTPWNGFAITCPPRVRAGTLVAATFRYNNRRKGELAFETTS